MTTRVDRRAWVVLAALASVGSWGWSRPAAAIEPETVARIIATGGVDGRFGVPVCEGDRYLVPHPLAAFTYALVRQAHATDRPLVLDTGGLLWPGGVARFAAEREPEALAALVAELGYRALALGENDLAARRARVLPVLEALARRGIPVIATNLRCGRAAHALCDVVVDARDEVVVLEAGSRTVAVVAMLDPAVRSRLAPDLAVGVSIDPISEALPRAVLAARPRADLVVAILGTGTDDALDLVYALEERERPDLVVLADSASRLLFARPTTLAPAIVAPPPSDAVEVIVREDTQVLAGVHQMIAQPLAQQGIGVAEPLLDLLDRLGPTYCATWGNALAGGHLARPLDAEGIATLVTGLMREAVGADVAVLNRAIIDSTFRPAHERELTASDLYVALEHDEPLYEAWVTRDWLTELAARRTPRHLLTEGLVGTGGDIRVRGRPLISRAQYRVVTIRFLAQGGDGALPALPAAAEWRPVLRAEHPEVSRAPSATDELEPGLTALEVALVMLARRDAGDPRDVRPPPGQAPEWIVQGNVDGTFSGSSVANPALYDAALLNRSSTVTLGIEVSLRADATAPDWTWENTGSLRYRTQWTQGTETMGLRAPGAFTEAVDQLQVRSTGSYRGLRATSTDPWVPDPYLEVFVESELTEPSTRSWHWLLLRPTVGARFPLTTDLELKLQAGVQAQVLQPEGNADVGFGALITLRPWDLLRAGEQRLQLQGVVDFFYADPGDSNRWQLRSSLDASLDLAGPLALTFGIRAYLQQDRGAELGLALDATAGVRLGALSRAVGP